MSDAMKDFLSSEGAMAKILRETDRFRLLTELDRNSVSGLMRVLNENRTLIDRIQADRGFLSEVTKQAEMLEKFSINVDEMSRLHRYASGLALQVQSAVLPNLETVQSLALQASTAIVPYLSTFEAAAKWQDSITSRMAGLSKPWAFEIDVGLSAVGFTRLARINDTLREGTPFEARVTELLTEELGEPFDSSADDPIERDADAVGSGLQPELIAFPPEEFGMVIAAAGFRFTFGQDVPQAGASPDPDARFDPAFNAALTEVENQLRRLVADSLASIEGPHWIKRRVHPDIRKKWKDTQDFERQRGRPVYDLIYYADFMELLDIITQKNNWESSFQAVFLNADDFAISLRRLAPIRNALSHSRPLGRADQLNLAAECIRIMKALGRLN